MDVFSESAKKSTTSSTRVNSKATFITAMVGTSTQTETITLAIGSKASGQVTENSLTKVVEYMKDNGSLASSSEKRERAICEKHVYIHYRSE